MAKIQKLKTRKPTPEEIKKWENSNFSHEELFILLLIETWRGGWHRYGEVPLFLGGGFSWENSEQGYIFWYYNANKAHAALKKYRP